MRVTMMRKPLQGCPAGKQFNIEVLTQVPLPSCIEANIAVVEGDGVYLVLAAETGNVIHMMLAKT